VTKPSRQPLPPFGKPSRKRSENMRAIRSFGNETTERRLVSLLRGHKLWGWRLHPPRILGEPDLLIRNGRIAVFVDGCFWHGCPKCGHIPKTNKAYWRAKIARNRARDARITRRLRKVGFSVVRLWECDLRARASTCLLRIERSLKRAGIRRPTRREPCGPSSGPAVSPPTASMRD
jgi:DNA mismatch endonuclease (patch repair protein)